MVEIIKLIEKLREKNMTISAMESCTGGCFVNEITNIDGASDVLKFSAVTYSNDFKIKMGVDSKLINKYSVYSMEVAKDMSKKISDYTGSDYGIGITGKINNIDDVVYVSIYDRNNNKYTTISIDTFDSSRKVNKEMIVRNIVKILCSIL